MGLLIALFVALAALGLLVVLSFLVVVAFVTVGYILHAREARRERQGEVHQALGEVDAILRGSES